MITTLAELRKSPIAQTDVGDLIALNGSPELEFLVEGTITKIRAGLFFIDIEGEPYTVSKLEGFDVGEKVICIIKADVDSNHVDIGNNNAHFVVKGLEKI